MILLLTACKENIDTSARYVFKHDIALSYLQKHEDYSQYVSLLMQTPISRYSQSKVGQLLGARGHYTVFAPTNEAIDSFLTELYQKDPDLLSAPSWDAFSSDEKRDSIRNVVVMNSIIDSGDMDECFMTWDFPTTDKAEIPLSNMNNRKLSVHYLGVDSILMNGKYPLDKKQRDIVVTNGVI
ncbi:MAG: fasciclin domain-containing protein, partial [Bacteroidaceae bacterium]|nr:fasciclin domain-containing protein [Bacteroidaceae bacterium]